MMGTVVSAPPLHRHQLAWLKPSGWSAILAASRDAEEQACLDHWAVNQLPLVVAQQREAVRESGHVALGLAAPRRWGRRRLALQARPGDFLFFGEFPSARDIANLLRGEDVRRDWRRLCAALQACGTSPRVPGSFGWQHLTGLPYVRSTSDIDLTIAVQDAHQADAVVALLQAWPEKGPRLDGELVFPEDAAIAWREWQAWRAGRVRTVLVKDLHGSRLCAQPVPMTDGEAVLA